jgi:hypothetical protein
VVVSRSSPAIKAAVVDMMHQYELSQAAGSSTGLVKW